MITKRGRSVFRYLMLGVGLACLMLPGYSGAADATVPTIPGNFQSRVETEEATVRLSWNASTDSAGIEAYRIERSLDQQNWTMLVDDLTTLSYDDDTAGAGVHYYYRLNATDTTGNVSGWATTDVATSTQTPAEIPKTSSIFTSEDGVAIVEIPNGATTAEVSCTLTLKEDPDKPGVADHALQAGPYILACKTLGGSEVREFKQAAIWVFNLENKTKGLRSPAIYAFDGDSRAELVEDSVYDAEGKTLKVSVWTTEAMAVLVEVPKGISPNLIVLILVVSSVVVGVVVLILRQRKKASYDEYMRSKYYDI